MKIKNYKQSIIKSKTDQKLPLLSVLFLLLSVLSMALLTLQNMRYTVTAPWTFETERVEILPQQTLPVWSIPVMAVLLTCCAGGLRMVQDRRQISDIFRNTVLVLILVSAAAVGFYGLRRAMPAISNDDAGICWSVAYELMENGDTASFEPGGYLVRYPQQAGLVCLHLMLFRLFIENETQSFYLLNLFLFLITMLAGALTARFLETKGDRNRNIWCAEPLFLLFMLTGLPAWLYVGYLYGETASTAAMVVGAYGLMRFIQGRKCRLLWLLLILPAVALGVLLRKNTLIFVIACLLVLLVYWIRTVFSWQPLLCMILLMLTTVLVPHAALNWLYARADTGAQPSKGIPATAHIAMGLQDEWDGPGWYNDYNRVLFDAYGEDSAATDQAAKQEIMQRMAGFMADPGYGMDFFSRKLTSQWCEPTSDAFYCCLRWFDDQAPFLAWMRSEEGQGVLRGALSLRLGMLYVGGLLCAAVALAAAIRKHRRPSAGMSVLFLTVLGGIAFSLLWEAKSRYCVEYLTALVPLAALGYAQAGGKWFGLFRQEKGEWDDE